MFKTPLKLFVTGFKKKFIQRHPFCLIDVDCDYILYEIKIRDTIEFERNLSGNSYKEYY